MSLASFVLALSLRLPRRRSGSTRLRNIPITARDGMTLATEVFLSRLPGKHPTVLMRVPYGRNSFAAVGEIFAERGYNAIIQDCRGTGTSGGEFDPLANERADGLDTLAWIEQQPWYDGRLGLSGASYLGYAAWAIADALPPQSALAIKISSSEFNSIVFPNGAFHLGLWLSWMQVIVGLRSNALQTARRMAKGEIERATSDAAMTLPLIDADRRITGNDVPFWKRWLTNAIGNPAFWEPMDHMGNLGPGTPPTSFVSGWYDFMLDQLLRDYATLRAAGQNPHLTVGPWFHISQELQSEGVRDTFRWMNAHLLEDRSELREKSVRLFIGGRKIWREFDSYPPPLARTETLHLHPGQALGPAMPAQSAPDSYVYDPKDPTPAVGGAMFAFTGAGDVDQARLEARKDVVLFTSEPLTGDLTVVGNVETEIFLRANTASVDLFARLADVDRSGKSINICDGIMRKVDEPPAPDGTILFRLRLHATAHCFRAGHRLRLLIASGAHPRFARNTGTDEPIATATQLEPTTVEIFHDPAHPSLIRLPVAEI